MTGSAREAKRYSLRLLAYRQRTVQELRERLSKRGYSHEAISLTIDALQQSGLINDQELAENVIRQAQENKLLSYEGTKKYLMQRGVLREVIEGSLVFDEARELETAKRLIGKKMRFLKKGLSPKERRRIWNSLIRKGFSFDIANRALKLRDLTMEDEK